MKPNALADCNPRFSYQSNIYHDVRQTTVNSSNLSSYLSVAVPQLLNASVDKRLFSFELECLLNTPELRHEFSYAPYNMLRACDFNALANRKLALDLSQDFGGTAHFLSELFEQVDAIKLDIGRAKYSQQRFQSTQNINYFSHELNSLIFPERHYDIIIIGKLEDLELNNNQAHTLFRKLYNALTDNGILVLSLKNRDRLSKWINTDSHEYDPLTPHSELYAYEHKSLFNLTEIEAAINSCGFLKTDINASFSARATVPNLFSLNYLDTSASALNHFYRIGSVACSSLNEYLMYKSIAAQGKSLGEIASRFIVFAGKNTEVTNKFYDYDFVHFPGTGRLPHWRTITSKLRDKSCVTKHTVFTEKHTNANGLLSQNLAQQKFHQGSLLLDTWLATITNNDSEAFTGLVKHYHGWLTELQVSGLETTGGKDEECKLERFSDFAYDLLPFNIICSDNKVSGGAQDGNKSYRIIDPEWRINAEIDADFVLFRALFWFAFDNRALMAEFCDHWGFQSINAFVRHYLNVVSNDHKIDEFIELEEHVQLEISSTFNAKSICRSMDQGFSSTSYADPALPTAQVTWANAQDDFDQANTIYINWLASDEVQTLETEFRHFDSDKKILRVDPVNNTGLFQFESVALLDRSNEVIWEITSSKNIAALSDIRNAIASADDTTNSTNFVALSSDPFFLFDLSHLTHLDAVCHIKLVVSLTFEPNYHNALERLRSLVGQQALSIISLGNKGHETRADIDLLKAKLQHTENERRHLANQVSELNHVRDENKVLHESLMRTPSEHLKRGLKTIWQRLGSTPK